LESLGPGVMFGGLPLSGVYSSRAVRRAPDRPWAWSGLTLSTLAITGLVVLLVLAALGR
jgi:hypothetical protein